ncbi:MAG: hypothetical protein H0X44_08755 [Acidobacteria bacterium]|nr:hypothetical protein [Acidobacteriota bacterium]
MRALSASRIVVAGMAIVLTTGCGSASPTAPGSVAAEISAVRDATWAFHDINQAVAAGYASPAGGHCDQSPAGAMGVHAANQALIGSQTLDPTQPEVLLYLPTGGGKYALVGVEYLQPVLLRNPATGAVAPWFAPEPWPSTFVPITPAPTLFGQTFQGPMPGHVPGMPWHYDLHVWAWSENPSGRFTQWNPSLSCAM